MTAMMIAKIRIRLITLISRPMSTFVIVEKVLLLTPGYLYLLEMLNLKLIVDRGARFVSCR